MSTRKDIFVYADWIGMDKPKLMGTLSVDVIRGSEVFSFDYENDWIASNHQQLDPDLQLYSGDQYLTSNKKNFGLFTDSSPDRWGKMLMLRREAVLARSESRTPNKLYISDFLLGVYDKNRMGALRFKLDVNDDFLSNNQDLATPPWTSIRELEHASLILKPVKFSSAHC